MKRLLFSSLLTIFSVLSFAQTGNVRGFIYDKASGEPISFSNAMLEGTNFGAAADVNGFFSINKVPVGSYTLVCSFVGYEASKTKITVTAGENSIKKIYLDETGLNLEEVVVSGEKTEAQTTVRMSVIKATKKDITAVPAVGGESDIATYFQTVPGVVSTGDQGGQLYVRGGAPVQNMVLMDGMIVYNPFHSIGFFSVFDTDIIRNADIYTGGFNAEYGGRISSVMDITTRDGNKREFDGKISVTPFGAKLLAEGPLKKLSEDGNSGSISYIFSGKTSYLAQTSKLFYSYVDTAGLPFNFTDLYGKITFDGNKGSKFNVFGFHFTDSVKYQAISDLRWNSYGAGANFIMLPPGSPVYIQGNFSYSHYGISLDDKTSAERFSEVDGFNLGFDFKYFLKKDEIKYGIGAQGFATNFTTYNSVNRKIEQFDNNTQLSAYLVYKMNRGRLLIEPSFRMMYYASLVSKYSPEPRIGVKFNTNENFRIKGAAGIYSQNLIAANSDRDVVNLFYGFLSGSNNIPQSYIDEDGNVVDRKHVLQKANHYILGFEYDITKKITLNVEGYIKDFTQLTNINRNKIFDESEPGVPDLLKKDYIIETGAAYGIDFLAKYKGAHSYFWFTYSLGKVTRWDGIQTYNPIFDRRHNINIVGTQMFGKGDLWEVNMRWNFGSGLPFTPTQGYYQNEPFYSVNTDYTVSNSNEVSIIYGDLNSARQSTYHRLDITGKKKWQFKKIIEATEEGKPSKEKITSELEVLASVTNVYNRRNIFYVDRISGEKVYQLPIIPAIGFSYNF